MHHRANAPREADRLREVGQFLKGVPEQDKGHDFKLFAERFGKRSRNGQDELHHLHAQDERESQMNRLKVAYGRDMFQPRRQHPLTVGLDAQKPRKVNEKDNGSERTLRAPMIP